MIMSTRSDDIPSTRRIGVRLASWFGTPCGLLCLFALSLFIRLILARHSGGLRFDVSLFRQWSDRLVEVGLAHFYAPGYFADYLPGYLYLLHALGKVSRLLSGSPPSVAMLKLPAMVADLGVGVLALLLAARITPGTRRAKSQTRAAAAVAILLNPGIDPHLGRVGTGRVGRSIACLGGDLRAGDWPAERPARGVRSCAAGNGRRNQGAGIAGASRRWFSLDPSSFRQGGLLTSCLVGRCRACRPARDAGGGSGGGDVPTIRRRSHRNSRFLPQFRISVSVHKPVGVQPMGRHRVLSF